MTSSSSSSCSRSLPVVTVSNPAFLESARPALLTELNEHLIPDIAKIVVDYAIQGKAFMAEDWKRYYNVEVEDLQLGPEFYDWWFQPDKASDTKTDEEKPSKLNCDTHFPPILCPETLLETAELPPPALQHRFASYVDRTDYSLETLGRLIRNPKEGHPSRFMGHSKALKQNGKSKAGPACYIVARKELLARNLPIDEQRKYMEQVNAKTRAGYEVLPRALHLATAALVHYTVTKERYLGDKTGMEKQWSFGLSEDTFEHYGRREAVVVGGQKPYVPRAFLGPDPASGLLHGIDIDFDGTSGGLFVNGKYFDNDFGIGVVGLQKFSAHRKLNT